MSENKSVEEITKEVQKLKQEIADATEEKAQAQGARDSLLERLKNDFELKNVTAADKKVKKLEIECQELQEEIQEKFIELEKDYEW